MTPERERRVVKEAAEPAVYEAEVAGNFVDPVGGDPNRVADEDRWDGWRPV